MMTKLRHPLHSLDQFLFRRGFTEPLIRGIVRRGLLIAIFSLLAGGVLAIKTSFLFWFGIGSLLAVWNFWALAKRVSKLLPAGWSAATLMGLLLHTASRLLVTGIFLYIFLILCKASPFPLVLGLTTVVIQITIDGIANAIPERAAHLPEKEK